MNLPLQEEDAAPPKRPTAEQAIQLALESKWEEAAAVNRSILEANADDVDALNRMGKALLELGRYREAREAYARSLALDPVNTIAKRNLDRLATLGDADEPRPIEATGKVAHDLFIEEVGKSGTSALFEVPRGALVKAVAGDEVYLKADGDVLRVENASGEPLGHVEPKMGLRLLRLMEGGNRYAAAIKTVSESEGQVIIKEVYRDPSQTKLSFPAVGTEGVRAYIRESLLRYESEDEEEEDDSEDAAESEDWEESEAQEGISLSSLSAKESLADLESDEDEEG